MASSRQHEEMIEHVTQTDHLNRVDGTTQVPPREVVFAQAFPKGDPVLLHPDLHAAACVHTPLVCPASPLTSELLLPLELPCEPSPAPSGFP